MECNITGQTLYYCQLLNINNRNVVVTCFYRAGDSVKDVMEHLTAFEWPEGVWEITDTENDENGEAWL